MKRRSLLQGMAALPIITGLGKFLSWANPIKRSLGKVAISAKPETIIIDSNYPEASIDLKTGKMYIEVSDEELLNKEFLPTFEERLKNG